MTMSQTRKTTFQPINQSFVKPGYIKPEPEVKTEPDVKPVVAPGMLLVK